VLSVTGAITTSSPTPDQGPPGPKPAAPIVEYKRSLANLAKHDITQLTALVKSRLRRMQYRPDLIAGFLAGTRLDFTAP
jgi:hypothetical protein